MKCVLLSHLWSRDASYLRHTSLIDMTIVGAFYQTTFNRLILQSCQTHVARDVRYEPRSYTFRPINP
jgi:hypothetical protein